MTKLISDTELKARETLAQIDFAKASTEEMLVSHVFKALWSSSLPVDRIEAIATAMFQFPNLDLQETLTSLARRRILRSRKVGRQRLYEINY